MSVRIRFRGVFVLTRASAQQGNRHSKSPFQTKQVLQNLRRSEMFESYVKYNSEIADGTIPVGANGNVFLSEVHEVWNR